jgi:transposase
MRTTKLTTKDYTEFHQVYQLKLPLELEILIPVDDSVRLLSQMLEGLDYTKLYQAYSIKGRKPAVDPKIMFKVLTYAYMSGIYTTHKIEQACRRDINFLWLLAGNKAPDHATVARFRQKYLAKSVDDLFYQMVNGLYEMGEIRFENVFIDGTKIEANANRYTFVWKSAVNKNELKMFEKIKSLVSDINLAEIKGFTVSAGSLTEDITKILDYLNEKKVSEEIEFVHGTGKRKTLLQRWIEQLEEYKTRQDKYNESNRLFQGRNSYSKTDTDATFMHMKDDHMRNSQLKPGYNVQIGVESEYVTGVGIFQDRNDIATLIPMLEKMKENLGRKYANVIADSGYESEENYLYLEKNSQIPYIKPQTYEIWKKKSFKNDISKRENMIYDGETDEYTCHNGKKLKKSGVTHKTSATGYRSEVTMYECESCESCQNKSKCTKAAGNRKMQVSKTFVEKREVSCQNIMSEAGILLRVNRSIQVEGAFGVLKNDYSFTRFLTRGKTSVKTEFILLCFGYNINKLHSKIQSERCGKHLHPLKETA